MSRYATSGSQSIEERAVDSCRDIPWKCRRCDLLLGFGMDTPDGKTHMRLRTDRGIYIWVTEPEVLAMTCRRCGFQNFLQQVGKDPVTTIPGMEPTAPGTANGVPDAATVLRESSAAGTAAAPSQTTSV